MAKKNATASSVGVEEMNSFPAPRPAASLAHSSNRNRPTLLRRYRASTKSMERFIYCSPEPPKPLSSAANPTSLSSAMAQNTRPPEPTSQARYLVIWRFLSSLHWRTTLSGFRDHMPSDLSHTRWQHW